MDVEHGDTVALLAYFMISHVSLFILGQDDPSTITSRHYDGLQNPPTITSRRLRRLRGLHGTVALEHPPGSGCTNPYELGRAEDAGLRPKLEEHPFEPGNSTDPELDDEAC